MLFVSGDPRSSGFQNLDRLRAVESMWCFRFVPHHRDRASLFTDVLQQS